MSEALLELRGLELRHGPRLLVEGVDLDVMPGEITALMGPSGSGKSITAWTIMGCVLTDPGVTAGSLRFPAVDERDWLAGCQGSSGRARLLRSTQDLRGRFFTYAPQSASSALNPGRCVGQQLSRAMRRGGVAPEAIPSATRQLLQEVGLPADISRSLPGELSGGMCQRVALALALAPQPKLVIADEPETGLDPILTRRITERLLSLCKDRGCGLLLISHHQETVDRVADRVVRLPGRSS